MRNKNRRRYLFAFIPLVLLLLGGEAALRGAGFEYQSYYDCPDWWTRCSQNPIFIGDADRFWKLKPRANSELNPESRQTQSVNSAGFRDDETPTEKAPGELRIISLGDSCTFGDSVANWEAYPNVLEKLICLADPDRPVNVINAGVPGYTAWQIDVYLRSRLLAYKPDVVTIYVGFNDNIPAAGGVPDKEMLAWRSKRMKAVQTYIGRFRLYQYFNKFISSFRRKVRLPSPNLASRNIVDGMVFRVSMTNYVELLCGINELGAKSGFTTLLMTLPHVFPSEPERNHFIRAAAGKCSIPLLDLRELMKEDQAKGLDLFNSDGGHPNSIGHRLIAQHLFRKLQSLSILPQSPMPELPPIPKETPEPDQFPAKTNVGF